ncbi:hypothetical protein GGR22_000917 [Flavobacterium gossypii]|uniref:Outer membrane protein beta-barrel domain-containing protein n=1 Tax=Flavobacterium gossypii TaxID=1646119 RepID=A0ABR6DM82_9FLAO|nr:hypothetical protein [Flavobacterium gossypii]MBA9072791.1 hypothetical protein [Flavobacterium gossypii]
MENKKDIGKAFRDKIDGLDKSPSPKVWDSINAELKKKKKRRLLPFWIKTTGIAILFLFLLLPFSTLEWSRNFPFYNNTKTDTTEKNNSSNGTNDNNNSTTNSIDTSNSGNSKIGHEKINSPTSKDNANSSDNASALRNGISSSEKSKITKFKSNNVFQKKSKNKALAQNSPKTAKSKSKKSRLGNRSSEKAPFEKDVLSQTTNTTIAENQRNYSPNTETDLTPTEKKKDSLKEKKKEKKPEVKDEKKTVKDSVKPFSKFYVFGYVAPTYYGLFSNKSSLDNRLENNKSSAEFTFNFGGYIGVNITERLNLRLGASLSKFNTITQNVNFNTSNFENIEYKSGITNSSIAVQFNNENLDIREEYSFLEIPFELKYTLLDKKIGIEAIGGISTLYLNKNTIEVEKNNQSLIIGKRSDLLKVHFTTNFGAGFYYKISKNLRFNAEPIFKYHFNPSEGSPKKISFGLQTGLQYNLNN